MLCNIKLKYECMKCLMQPPVDRAAALVIGGGAVVSSYVVGQLAKNYYLANGAHIDLASATKVNALCK